VFEEPDLLESLVVEVFDRDLASDDMIGQVDLTLCLLFVCFVCCLFCLLFVLFVVCLFCLLFVCFVCCLLFCLLFVLFVVCLFCLLFVCCLTSPATT